MKRMAAVFLMLALSIPAAQAGSLAGPAGSDAQQLAHALWSVMGVTSCVRGSCVFHAVNIKCVETDEAHAGCAMEAVRTTESNDPAIGSQSRTERVFVRGARAAKLMQLLVANGIELKQGETHTEVRVGTLACWKEFRTPAQYSCDWSLEVPADETSVIELEPVEAAPYLGHSTLHPGMTVTPIKE